MMSWDNRIFNVNGRTDEQLLAALKLVFNQSGFDCSGWISTPTHGLILLWHADDKGANKFPAKVNAEQVLPHVKAWLSSKDAEKVERKDWDAAADHDGSNGPGWRVYCEAWGHVANLHSAICGIKPVTLWYGK
jgi:hypothetical protein